jgi:protein arginine kinase
MQISDLVSQVAEWLKGNGPDSEIVFSSRIRLARNLKDIPFTHRGDSRQLAEVLKKVNTAVKDSDYLSNSFYVAVDQIEYLDRTFLVERQLISLEHAQSNHARGVNIGDKEIVSIMVNEEDHLRFQVLQSGLQLVEAWRLVNKIDKELENKIDYAFSNKLGYLTACPTNVGTGMRASVMLHLPALVVTKEINKILNGISKLGITFRGLYGEGTEPASNLFQLSNQITLGHKEDEIIDNIERVARRVINYEKKARNVLSAKQKGYLENKIYRAWGILKNARLIDSRETMDLLSSLRLGVDMKIIKDIDYRVLNELFVLTQPAHLQKLENKELRPSERDETRADLIRRRLKNG